MPGSSDGGEHIASRVDELRAKIAAQEAKESGLKAQVQSEGKIPPRLGVGIFASENGDRSRALRTAFKGNTDPAQIDEHQDVSCSRLKVHVVEDISAMEKAMSVGLRIAGSLGQEDYVDAAVRAQKVNAFGSFSVAVVFEAAEIKRQVAKKSAEPGILTDEALSFLPDSLDKFYRSYGSQFVYAINQGKRMLAIIHYQANSRAQKEALVTTLNLAYQGVVFGGDFSEANDLLRSSKVVDVQVFTTPSSDNLAAVFTGVSHSLNDENQGPKTSDLSASSEESSDGKTKPPTLGVSSEGSRPYLKSAANNVSEIMKTLTAVYDGMSKNSYVSVNYILKDYADFLTEASLGGGDDASNRMEAVRRMQQVLHQILNSTPYKNFRKLELDCIQLLNDLDGMTQEQGQFTSERFPPQNDPGAVADAGGDAAISSDVFLQRLISRVSELLSEFQKSSERIKKLEFFNGNGNCSLEATALSPADPKKIFDSAEKDNVDRNVKNFETALENAYSDLKDQFDKLKDDFERLEQCFVRCRHLCSVKVEPKPSQRCRHVFYLYDKESEAGIRAMHKRENSLQKSSSGAKVSPQRNVRIIPQGTELLLWKPRTQAGEISLHRPSRIRGARSLRKSEVFSCLPLISSREFAKSPPSDSGTIGFFTPAKVSGLFAKRGLFAAFTPKSKGAKKDEGAGAKQDKVDKQRKEATWLDVYAVTETSRDLHLRKANLKP